MTLLLSCRGGRVASRPVESDRREEFTALALGGSVVCAALLSLLGHIRVVTGVLVCVL